MENASKALIIAGAILLAILLISLGILIFSQAQDTVNNSGMSQAEITAFNNKFLKYEGNRQKGSVVKSLINEVLASNSDSSLPDVTVTVDGETKTSTSDIDTKKEYKVELEYENTADSDNLGYVKNIKITTNS